MYPIARWIMVFCLILATGKEAFGQVKPLNAVTESGGEVIFNCSGTAFRPNWIMSKDGSTTNQWVIAGSCVVVPGLENHYMTDPTRGPTVCNLIVISVTTEQAGVYWCSDGVTAPSYALLTVMGSSSTMAFNDTPEVIETETVVITCSVNYNGSVSPAPTLRPHYYWTDGSGQIVSGFVENLTESKVVSEISVTAGRQDIAPLTCRLYLELDPHDTAGYANNTPTVNNSASSPHIVVLYAPSLPNIVATASGFSDCQAMNLACYSDANPSPTYTWMDNIYGNVTNAQNITAEYGVNYTCTALNVIRNNVYSNSSSFHEASIANKTCNFALTSTTTSHSTQQPPRSTEQPPQYYVDSSAETAAIVLGVLLAISIAFHIICFFLYRKGIFKPRDSSKSDVNKPTNNSEEAHYQDLCKETLATKPEYEELPR